MSVGSFDGTYYPQNNPDVLAAISNGLFTSAEQHFNLHGWREGRDPNANFDASAHQIANPDVLAAGINPFAHFARFGAAEGRSPNSTVPSASTFDAAAYEAANPDVAAAVAAGSFTSAYQHFVLFGLTEGRAAQDTNGNAITGPSASAGSTLTLTTDIASTVRSVASDSGFSMAA